MDAFKLIIFILGVSFLAAACQSEKPASPRVAEGPAEADPGSDVHSRANPDQIRVSHLDLDIELDFDRKVIRGTSTLTLDKAASGEHPLDLDTRDLKISRTETSAGGNSFAIVPFKLDEADKVLGARLSVPVSAGTRKVRVTYESSPGASGVQWLEPAQTAGKKHPYVFTQSQAIHARSWIPLQDSPAVRITYTAKVRTPAELRAVMSAEQDGSAERTGEYSFNMPQAIPPYLIALAAGDIAFKSLGARTGVYTEPSMLDRAARELADTEKMIEATEKLYGAYRWGRYDILVLPPSFPIGGMENPRLTFATPTILAGDKSLVSLIAHELAHSWSGNLVTNATWRDFWLNEGFTTYLERRIVEAVYGRQREEMEAALGLQSLEKEMAGLEARDQILHLDLTGRDPDEGFTGVPYEKGALFLRHLEETFGRERFDAFLKGYFDHFAFQSITTDQFRAYLKANLLDSAPVLAARVPIVEWITKPGLPASAPRPRSDAFAKVEEQANGWLKGETPAAKLQTRQWTTQEWLHFLNFLPKELTREQMEQLDRAFGLTKSGNAEIAHVWLLISIRNKYDPADARLEEYLTSIGRQKLIKPLYEELVKTPEGRQRARSIFGKARPGYHPIAAASVGKIVDEGG
ncbi:MAG: M1 family metallopeptidase [Acidobacteriota bacterium]|nr:MAG: M1 family metallopeptidase [Acidobacteriota bacterium]